MTFNIVNKQAEQAKDSMEQPTWFLGSKCESLSPYNRVQQGRFPHIGPSNQREFRQPVRRAILPSLTTLHKLRLHYPSAARIPAQNYVRALQNPTSQRGTLIRNINFRGNKELFDWNFDLGLLWKWRVGVRFDLGLFGNGRIKRNLDLGRTWNRWK